MSNLQNLTVKQLRKVVAIKAKIEKWTAKLASITGGDTPAAEAGAAPKKRGRRKMSAAARAAIGAAQRRRWAKVKRKGRKALKKEKVVKAKRKVSAATKAKLAASTKARWAKAKAAGEATL